jgi:PilZ domain
MDSNDLQSIANEVIRRAQQQGFVLRNEVRDQLKAAGLSETRWKEVITLAGASLRYRGGRYYHAPATSERVLKEQDQRAAIRRTVRQAVREHRAAARQQDRREENRVDFIQPVIVRTEDGRAFTLLSRDVSATGIRLIGTRRLLGQKVRVSIPRPAGAEPENQPGWVFIVRILWTCAVGEDLFENGGAFLEAVEPGT